MIAVPTTSGTGSEATHFAAIYVDGKKVSVSHPMLRPWAAILDERLHRAMPRPLAAVTGLDALGQAMESLWAVGSTEESRVYAAAGLKLIAGSLVASGVEADADARRAMMLGAHLAGRAINISKTTASHAMSYQLTQRFGIAHGHGVALTLGHVAAANAEVAEGECIDPRGVEHVRRWVQEGASILGCAPEELPGFIAGLVEQLGLPPTLAEAGVPGEALNSLSEAIDPTRMGNNPRRLSLDESRALLRRAFDRSAWQTVSARSA
jgi:alcohol dehydrogenase class IV